MLGRPAPYEYWRWRIARETGWTLEYIDRLSHADIAEYWQVLDGEYKASQPLPEPPHVRK